MQLEKLPFCVIRPKKGSPLPPPSYSTVLLLLNIRVGFFLAVDFVFVVVGEASNITQNLASVLTNKHMLVNDSKVTLSGTIAEHTAHSAHFFMLFR